MPGTTSKGFPYILGADPASSIDDTSLSLANKLEAMIPFAVSAGSISVTLTAAASGFTAITFPVGRFTIAPLVMATMASAPAGSGKFVPRVLNVTTSGASVYVYTGDATNASASVTVSWFAIQMTPSAANG